MAGDEIKHKNSFLMSLNGQLQSAFFPFFDDVYCKYSFVCGPDWVIISGVEEGISQVSKKGKDEEQLFVWNLPLNIVFKSTNPFGWPQLVISAYGSDVFDNEVVRGYGVCHVPIAPGRCEKEIQFSRSEIHVVANWKAARVYRPKNSHTRRCQRSLKLIIEASSKDFIFVIENIRPRFRGGQMATARSFIFNSVYLFFIVFIAVLIRYYYILLLFFMIERPK